MKYRKALFILLCILLNAGFHPVASAQSPVWGPIIKGGIDAIRQQKKLQQDIINKNKSYLQNVSPVVTNAATTTDVDRFKKMTEIPSSIASSSKLGKLSQTSIYDAEMKASRKSFQERYEGLFSFPISSGQFTRARVFTLYNPAIASHFYFACTDLTLCNSSIEDGLVVAIIPDEDSGKTTMYVYGNGYLYQYEGDIVPSVKEGDIVKPKAKLGKAKHPGVLSFYISRPGTECVPSQKPIALFLDSDEAQPLSLTDKEYRYQFSPEPRTFSVYMDCVAIEDNALWEKKSSALSKRLAEMDPTRSRKEWKAALSEARTKNKKFFRLLYDLPLADAFSLSGSGKERLRGKDGLIILPYQKPRTNF